MKDSLAMIFSSLTLLFLLGAGLLIFWQKMNPANYLSF